MAQAGFTPILVYGSTTPGNLPVAGNLTTSVNGVELAVNAADGKLFYKDSGGNVQVLATKAGASGDVVGPGSATANNIVLFDGTTGKLIKDAGQGLPSGTIVGTSDSQALTNKTINGSNNTITNVSLTTGVTGTLPVGNGGSGAASLTGVLIGNGASAFTTKTNPSGDFVGTSDAQALTNKTINGSSNTITNVSLSTAVTGTLPVGNGGSGATTLTGVLIGNGASAFTTKTNPSGAFVGTTDAQTLTNKRLDPRVSSATSSASITPDVSSFDVYALTAQAVGLTINAPIGTPVDGNTLLIRVLDNGSSQSITWNGTYTAFGVSLPTSTTTGKTMYFGCVYNAANTRWDVVAISIQV